MKTFDENFYTEDYDQEMLDFIDSNYTADKSVRGWSNLDLILFYSSWDNDFYLAPDDTDDPTYNKLTKAEFKQKIGMPTEETLMEKETVQEQATFGKKDLVDGMFVKCRNGNVFMKLGNTLNSLTGYLELDVYTDTLLEGESEDDWDIVEVYQTKGKECSLTRMLEKRQGLIPIWKRTPPKSEKVIKLKKLILLHEEQLEATKKLLEEELSL